MITKYKLIIFNIISNIIILEQQQQQKLESNRFNFGLESSIYVNFMFE
jgi:hypothetical protein